MECPVDSILGNTYQNKKKKKSQACARDLHVFHSLTFLKCQKHKHNFKEKLNESSQGDQTVQTNMYKINEVWA